MRTVHEIPISDLMVLAIAACIIWIGLYVLTLFIQRIVKKDKTPFIRSLISWRTLAFLLFSLIIMTIAAIQAFGKLHLNWPYGVTRSIYLAGAVVSFLIAAYYMTVIYLIAPRINNNYGADHPKTQQITKQIDWMLRTHSISKLVGVGVFLLIMWLL